jgi:hypothetical protein
MTSITYLAAPYSHRSKHVMEFRFWAINKVASKMIRDGVCVFSPISHTHPIAESGGLPVDFDYWQRHNRAWLERCQKVVVLKLDGWTHSRGVAAEIEIARELGIPVEYLEA